MATPDPLPTASTPEQQALCLGARTTLTPAARDRLAGLVRAGLRLGPAVGARPPPRGRPAAGRDAAGGRPAMPVPADWLARALKRRHVTLSTNARLGEALLDDPGRHGHGRRRGDAGQGTRRSPRSLYGRPRRPARAPTSMSWSDRADLPAARHVLRATRLRPAGGARATRPSSTSSTTRPGAVAPDPEHVRVELHWALWADSARRLGTDGLWDRSVAGTLMDQPIRTLSLEDTLLHLAIHRTRSALRLRWVVDVAELVGRSRRDSSTGRRSSRAPDRHGPRTASWVGPDRRARPASMRPSRPTSLTRCRRAGRSGRCWSERAVAAALFRPAPTGDVRQQPHLALRAFEEDGLRSGSRGVLGGSAHPAGAPGPP